jgi:hypothetical protein
MALGKISKRFINTMAMIPIHLQETRHQGRDVCRRHSLGQDPAKRLLPRSNMDPISLYGRVALLHRDPQQRYITPMMLGTGFRAAAQVNVHGLIEVTVLCEVVGELEGMAGRIGGRSATTPVAGTCHQRAPGMGRRVMQSQLFDGLAQCRHTFGGYIGNQHILPGREA